MCREVEADHDVSRVQVGVNEIVNKEHVEKSIEALVSDFLLKYPPAVFKEGCQGDALGEFLDKDLSRGMAGVRVGEPSRGSISEFLAKHGQISRFDAEIQLQAHHFAKLSHFVW